MNDVIIDDEAYLAHYGIRRKSGRYPWGSGETPHQRAETFLEILQKHRAEGMSDPDIAKMYSTEEHPFNTKHLRMTNTVARNAKKAADIARAQDLSAQGHSNIGIGKKMGINESVVRSLLKAGEQDKIDVLTATTDMLRDEVDKGGFIQIGKGVATSHGISNEKLASAVGILEDEGYRVHNVQVPQAGTANKTSVLTLCPPGTTYRDVKNNMDQIRQINQKSDDGGRTFFGLLPPKSLDSKRVQIAYKEDGGDEADGVLYVRPGVDDLSMGGSRYAQVRILVDGTHYMKGMAIYRDDLPRGVDVIYNTNKTKESVGGDKHKVFKEITDDPDNPFGAQIAPGGQIGKTDPVTGKVSELTSVMNLINKEGDWAGWKKSISSQVLSKQSPRLAEQQLAIAFNRKKAELDEIMSLTNPVVKKKLLESFADSADSDAVHLKGAAFKDQASQVILPLKTIKDTEIYAPNYRHGDQVALIRYPHGGKFEIPELTVNNRHPEGKNIIGPNAADAVGISKKVADHLSGADYDGDTVLVIPNNSGALKSTAPLKGLADFDTKASYPPYDGMRTIDGGTYVAATGKVDYGDKIPSSKGKGQHMGMVSNLITDMTIQGATNDELARAVRHSMVVIDAEKHHLNYKLSAERNGIRALQKKYQPRDDGRYGGAATLISRATGEVRVRDRRLRKMGEGEGSNRGPIDPATGKKVYVEKPGWVDQKTGEMRYKMRPSTKLAETDDAYTLLSREGGTKIEKVYADHSNRMKDLANEARKANYHTGNLRVSSSAKKVYANEVTSLDAKLANALRNSPRERQAQIYASTVVQAKRDANPNMDGTQIKRANAQALAEGRARFGAKKEQVDITPREWDAIQAGAISSHKLRQILLNADLEKVKEMATPRPQRVMSGGLLARAKTMEAAGRTPSEIAEALGVSVTTLREGLKNG